MKHFAKTPLLFAIITVWTLWSFQAYAQTSDSLSMKEDFAPPITLSPSKEIEKGKKKKKEKEEKPPKGIFYGIPAKKVILKYKRGSSITVEKFYILRQYQHPSRYVLDKYYFDPNAKSGGRKITKRLAASEKYGMPLHGPYEKRVNGEVIESGIYYLGSKHGRWMTYRLGQYVVDKMKYKKGYPKESRITYYDDRKTKVKEVVPIQHGEKKGQYLEFYPSGRVKTIGQYDNDIKVGKWHEYYDTNMRLRSKIVQYTDDPFEKKEPYVLQAWDKRGKKITDNSKN